VKAIFVPDIHAHDNSIYPKINALCDYIDLHKPKYLIFLGDLLDPWKAPWRELLLLPCWFRIRQTCRERRVDGIGENFLIKGNHDETFKEEWFPEAYVVRKFDFDIYHCEHGWQKDFIWGGLGRIPGVAPLAFFIADHFPWAMVRVHNFLFGKKGRTPGEVKTRAKTLAQMEAGLEDKLRKEGSLTDGEAKFIVGATAQMKESLVQEWTEHIGVVHDRYRRQGRKTGKIQIIAHTHCPHMDVPYLVCDAGDMVDSNTILQIEDDGPIGLVKIC